MQTGVTLHDMALKLDARLIVEHERCIYCPTMQLKTCSQGLSRIVASRLLLLTCAPA